MTMNESLIIGDLTQKMFTCLNLLKKTLEKGVKDVQS